jgi:hypothetical protein
MGDTNGEQDEKSGYRKMTLDDLADLALPWEVFFWTRR